MNVGLSGAADFDEAEENVLTFFGFFHGENADAGVICFQQRKTLAERAGMLGALESDERLIEAIGLPIGFAFAPVAIVPGNAENKFVMAEILTALIGISAFYAGSADESETQSIVRGFVRGILVIRENCCAESAAGVGEIDPLMGGNFKLALFFIGALDGADVPIVGSHFI